MQYKSYTLTVIISGLLFLVQCTGRVDRNVNPVQVMVVAGGHSFDTVEFVEMFREFSGISFDTVMQPEANRMIASGEADRYEAIVFYDMWHTADSATRSGYHRLLENGKGMVFLHHSLAGYQSWEEFRDIIGGKYVEQREGLDTSLYSTYKHDIEIFMEPVQKDHPVTNGLSGFVIYDEGYGNISVNSDIKVLLRADHPDCSEITGWENRYGNSTIIYLMPGHDKHGYQNENYRLLVKNSIVYVSKNS